MLSKNNGSVCFIVPDSINERSNFESIRSRILDECSIISILTLNKVFESATVGSTIISLSKGKSSSNVKLLQTNDMISFTKGVIRTHNIPQSMLEMNESKAFLFLSEQETILIQRLMESGQALEYFANFMGRGEEIGRNSNVISQEYGRNKLKFVNGSHVSRYSLLNSELFIEKADIQKNIRKYYISPKILVRQVGSTINATIDCANCICPQSIYVIRLSNVDDSKYVLGLLNSKLFNFLYQKKFNTKKLFPRILLENLKILPIKANTEYYKSLISLIDELYKRTPNSSEIENRIDILVYKIYGLSYSDVLIVDPETPIVREEYES